MKLQRLLGALCAAIMLAVVPARAAEQASYVTPITGPMNMGTFAGTYLNPALRALASCSWGTSSPSNGPSAAALPYQCWADTTGAPSSVLVKTYDGSSWVTIGQINTTTHVWTPYRAGAPILAVATSGSAADLTTGTLPAARLPNPSASTLGGVQSLTCSTSNWFRTISTSGVPGCSQPAFSDLTGSIAASQLPAFTGDVSTPAGSSATTIGANKVLDTMLRQSGALAIVGRSANSTGNVADIQATAGSSCVFRESSSALGCGQLATAALANNVVTNAKLAQMANSTIKCRNAAGTGDPEDCTPAQLRVMQALVVGTNVQAWDADLDAFALKTAPSGAVVGTTDTQTVTGKTFNCANNTCTVRLGSDVTGNLPLANMATIGADTLLMNASGSTAVPSAVSVGNCANALTYSTTTHTFGCNTTAGTGNVSNSGSSTDNAAARFDGTTGTIVQNGPLIIADTTGAISRSGGGGIPVQGTNTNQTTAAGDVGEPATAQLLLASATSLSTLTPKTITSRTLSAGNWLVWANAGFNLPSSTTRVVASLSTTTNVHASFDSLGGFSNYPFLPSGSLTSVMPVSPIMVSLSASTTYYLVATVTFPSGTADGFGSIMAVRLP